MADRVGQQLGNYRLVRLLGQGGFAEVYLGEHVYLGKQAAVKVLHTQLSSSDAESFHLEAQRVSNLEHPHIVSILDFGVEGTTPFLVMGYAPGGTLRGRHPKGSRLPLPMVVSYVKQLAEALQYAHDQKLIHRDIKPENMLIGRREEVLLGDFGIAAVVHSTSSMSTQMAMGTIPYMAPEQIQEHPRPASDQYALGVVVYEWLGGEVPFHGSFTEIMAKHVMVPPPSLREKLPMLSLAVEQVVMTALAKDPRQRFGQVQAFANALEQASQVEVSQTMLASRSPQPANDAPIILSPSQPSTAFIASDSQSFVPTELVTPVSQSSLPTERSTLANAPLVPTQFAGNAPLQQASFSASDNAATEVKPVMRPSSGKMDTPGGTKEQGHVWRIGKRQIVTAILGIAIYGALHCALGLLSVLSPVFSIPAAILLGISLTVPLFFGAEFGPWVGLVSAAIGALFGNYLLSYLVSPYFLIPWYLYAGIAIIGFFPGLAVLRTRGLYNTRRAIIVAIAMSAIGLVIGHIFLALTFPIGFATIGFATSSYFSVFFESMLFSPMQVYNLPIQGIRFTTDDVIFSSILPYIVSLILLPLLLFLYYRFSNRRENA